MQISSMFLRQQLGHFFWATAAAGALQLAGARDAGVRGKGVKKGSSAGGKGGAAPSPSARAG